MTSARSEAWRGLIVPGVLSVVALAILIGLGGWQMQRLHWKEDLIARAKGRSALAPLPLPPQAEWRNPAWRDAEYRAYQARGQFRHEFEVQVYTVLSDPKGTYSGAGYWVLTPLQLSDQSFVIVNRGFVPLDRKDPASRADSQPKGEVTVTGLLRLPEQPNAFTPANDPARRAWFFRDPVEIAAAFKLAPVAPFLLDAMDVPRPNALPQPNETKLDFVNNHLGYALTWFGLALTLIGVFVAFARQRLRSAEEAAIASEKPAP
jgi:surfeit locus 1 family protein